MKLKTIAAALAASTMVLAGCASDGNSSASKEASTSSSKSGFTSKTYTADGGDVTAAVKRALSARGWSTLTDSGNTIDARQVGRKQTSDVRVTVNGNTFTVAHIGGDAGGQLNNWVTNIAFDALVFTGMDRVTATERAGRRGRKR